MSPSRGRGGLRPGQGSLLLLLLLVSGLQPVFAADARSEDAADPSGEDAADPEIALLEGNRRFRAGDLEGAMAAYAAGYRRRDSDPILAYNLGVTAHRRGRLPEAVLWYRRAALALGRDRWLLDNLELARSALGAPERQPPPAWASWIESRVHLTLLAVVLSWAALPLLAVPARPRRWLIAALASLSCASFAAGALLGRLGPRAAVLLHDCLNAPAGSEVWVVRSAEGWRIVGEAEAPPCPDGAVGLVEP